MQYDPSVVTYDELLDVFWAGHDATSRPFANQYASLILVSNDAQAKAAHASLERYKRVAGATVWTTVEPLGRFYPAEDYHQKYYLRNERSLMREFSAMYPSDADFVASTAAARVNGYLALKGDRTGRLAEEVAGYGLSDAARDEVLERAGQAGYCAPVTNSAAPGSGAAEQR